MSVRGNSGSRSEKGGPRFMTLFEAGRCCGVSPKTVANWIEAGKLKAYKTVGGHRRVRVTDLNEFLSEIGMPLVNGEPSEEEQAESYQRKILVVDDDEIIVETLVLALEEDEHDYEVASAADGFEAGLQVSRMKPDLVILDLMMPDIDGYEVCRRLKADPETAKIKVIVLSAYLDDDNSRRMKEYGADVCFAKPLPLDDLRRHVATLLGVTSHREHDAEVASIGETP